MDRIVCKCGAEYCPTRGDLCKRYTKKKPNGNYKTEKVAYCPNCGSGVVVDAKK